MKRALFVLQLLALASLATAQTPAGIVPSRMRNGKTAPSPDAAFFPIAVWLQSPANAGRYKAAGFNTYVGLWDGPTGEQLATLKKSGHPGFLRTECRGVETPR